MEQKDILQEFIVVETDHVPVCCDPLFCRPFIHDKVGDLGAELGDIDSHLAMLRQQVKQSEAEIMPFIQSIEDSQCRLIFRLRFIHGLSWGEVADFIGGRNTEQSVKMICYRFLESCDAM